MSGDISNIGPKTQPVVLSPSTNAAPSPTPAKKISAGVAGPPVPCIYVAEDLAMAYYDYTSKAVDRHNADEEKVAFYYRVHQPRIESSIGNSHSIRDFVNDTILQHPEVRAAADRNVILQENALCSRESDALAAEGVLKDSKRDLNAPEARTATEATQVFLHHLEAVHDGIDAGRALREAIPRLDQAIELQKKMR